MIPMIIDHIWQSTVFAAAVALLTHAFRKNRANVRYWLWFTASVKFLIPFAALIALGNQFQWQSAPTISQPAAAAISTISHPFSQIDLALVSSASVPTPSIVVPMLLIIVWLTGSLAILSRWCLRWRQVAAVARKASPITQGRELQILREVEQRNGIKRSIPLASTDSMVEPGIFGIFRPVLLWPRQITDRLDDAQVEAIVAHEVCHVARRDNLFASIHMFVEALFWFHPLVWWIGARLIDQRERACDEDVISLGSEPRIYAESILKTCEVCLESPLANMAGVSGGDLIKRIEQIMANHPIQMLTAWKRALIVVIALAAVAAPLLAGAQSPVARLAFEVASIKLNKSGAARTFGIGFRPTGRFTATNATLKELMRTAYRRQPFEMRQMSGGPNWIDSDRFDIVAQAQEPPGTDANTFIMGMSEMVRTLLEDRFKLVVHDETRDLPIYALVLARTDGRLGPRLIKSNIDCEAVMNEMRKTGKMPPPPAAGQPIPCALGPALGRLTGGSITMSQLAQALSPLINRSVIDRTRLAGAFDLTVEYAPDELRGDTTPGVSIFTALQEQLGLKLESRTGPVDVLVIDHVEQPTPD